MLDEILEVVEDLVDARLPWWITVSIILLLIFLIIQCS